MELYPGATIAGRYRVDRRIGAGGMGEVWAGEHVAIGVRVALKTLLPAAALDRQVVARFRREAQLLGRLRSERVARIVDFVEDPEFGLVLVMEFVEGELLGAVLATESLGVDQAIQVGADLASALCDLHRAKVVHRDLKPDNVILEPVAGGQRRAVIVDLGVGRIDAEGAGDDAVTSLTQADTAVGTLSYMAPEQLLSSSTATAAADVYALGAILYRALSGEPVFGDEEDAAAARRKLTGDAPPLSLRRIDAVASGLARVVARALRRDPDERATAEEMLVELTALSSIARALSLDLDAPTEQALPLEHESAPRTSEGPTTRPMSHPPVHTSSRPGSAGAVSVDVDGIADEATTVSPASQALPRASDEALAPRTPAPTTSPSEVRSPSTRSGPSTPPLEALDGSSIRQTRPTVHSPMLAPKTLVVPSREAERPAEIPLAMVSRRAAVIGVLLALVAGAALGFAGRQLLVAPRPATHLLH